MQLAGNQGSSLSGQRWLHSNELKRDHRLKISSAIRSVIAFQVTCECCRLYVKAFIEFQLLTLNLILNKLGCSFLLFVLCYFPASSSKLNIQTKQNEILMTFQTIFCSIRDAGCYIHNLMKLSVSWDHTVQPTESTYHIGSFSTN